MSQLDLCKYVESEPHRLKRIVWYVLNRTLFRILPKRKRNALLRLFGSEIGWGYISRSVNVHSPWNLKIGNCFNLGPNVDIYNKDMVTIGSSVIISRDVFVCTASHDISSSTFDMVKHPIIISDESWIAAKAIVLPGATIGSGAVVGAGAVVAKDVPAWSVVVGNPAKVVGERKIQA